jgi:hypothetical protein
VPSCGNTRLLLHTPMLLSSRLCGAETRSSHTLTIHAVLTRCGVSSPRACVCCLLLPVASVGGCALCLLAYARSTVRTTGRFSDIWSPQ